MALAALLLAKLAVRSECRFLAHFGHGAMSAVSPLLALKRRSLADINCFTSPAPSTVRLRRSLPPTGRPRAVRVQSLSDFADRQECAGSRLFDFQPLFVVSLNEADDSVQYRQRHLRWRAFSCLQGFHYFCCFLGIAHGC